MSQGALRGVFCSHSAVVLADQVARRAHHPVRARSLPLVLFSAGSATVMAMVRGVEETVTPPDYPCDAAFFSSMLFPMCIAPASTSWVAAWHPPFGLVHSPGNVCRSSASAGQSHAPPSHCEELAVGM